MDETENQKDQHGKEWNEFEMEDIYDMMGGSGVYQWAVFLFVGSFSVFGVEAIGMNFVGGHQDHWCYVEELKNFSHSQQKDISIPFDSDNDYEGCKMFDLNYSSYSEEILASWNRSLMVDNLTATKDCQDGWIYDQSVFVSTITSKLDLVCTDRWMISMLSTCFMAGILVGAVGSGFLSDKYGRKTTINASLLLKIAANMATVYPLNYPWIAITRFLLGAGSTGAYLTGFILIMEIVGFKLRGPLGVTYQQQFALGFMLWPAVAYFIRDDIKVQLAMAIPVLALLSSWWVLDETPLWLLVKERYDEADVVIRKIATVNNQIIPYDFDIHRIKKAEKEVEKRGCLDLLKTPRLRMRSLIVDFYWFTCSMMYYALSLNAGSLPGSVFFNTFLAGAVEVPANFLAIIFLSWHLTGRKLTCSVSMIVAGVASFVFIYTILEDVETAQTVLAMVSKGFVTIGFSGIYVFTSELFPTEVRNVGVGTASMCARFGGMIAPYMGHLLEDIWKPLPSVVTGSFAVTAGLLTLWLPETLNQPMLTTIEEAEAFGSTAKDHPIVIETEVDVKQDSNNATHGAFTNEMVFTNESFIEHF